MFEDSTWVISSHKAKKVKQYNGQEKKRKDKSQWSTKHYIVKKDRATQTVNTIQA